MTSADHILFGTDWPAAPEPTVVHNIDNLTGFDGFTEDELRGVERDNASGCSRDSPEPLVVRRSLEWPGPVAD